MRTRLRLLRPRPARRGEERAAAQALHARRLCRARHPDDPRDGARGEPRAEGPVGRPQHGRHPDVDDAHRAARRQGIAARDGRLRAQLPARPQRVPHLRSV